MSGDRTPERPRNLLEYEERFWGRGRSGVVGIDEAGRGPLAGPVVAAAVLLPKGVSVAGVKDSKQLPRSTRESLLHAILGTALAVGIGAASVREIDRLNILQATTLAMNRAFERIRRDPGCPDDPHVVVDGLPVRGLSHQHEAVVGGDGIVHSIACASVVAKVVRDRLMHRLAERYPGYGWETNVGYGTPEHRAALGRLGPTPHHRLSFGGVQLDLRLG
jgi:ribonuclease HII